MLDFTLLQLAHGDFELWRKETVMNEALHAIDSQKYRIIAVVHTYRWYGMIRKIQKAERPHRQHTLI